MKASNSRQFSSVAAQTLKVVGIILILSALLDCIVLSLPGETSDLLNSVAAGRNFGPSQSSLAVGSSNSDS
jgi:hypothetical protein